MIRPRWQGSRVTRRPHIYRKSVIEEGWLERLDILEVTL